MIMVPFPNAKNTSYNFAVLVGVARVDSIGDKK